MASDALSDLTNGLFSIQGLTVASLGLLRAQPPSRQLVRERIVQKLRENVIAGSRIFTTRTAVLQNMDLPCVLVHTGNEEVEVFARSPLIQRHTLDLMLDVYVSISEKLEDQVDELVRLLTTIVLQDVTQENTVVDTVFSSLTVDYIGEGDRERGLARLLFPVTYQTMHDDYVSDDLEELRVTWDQDREASDRTNASDILTYTGAP